MNATDGGAMLTMTKPKGPTGEAPEGKRKNVFSVAATVAWRDWVVGLAEHVRASSIPDLLDRALVAYAKSVGYDVPPPKR
jgi:hypothetical protein